jgi:hypothetical protein
MATLVNGVSYNYANINISILGVQPKGVRSIDYAVSRATTHFYGVGDQPVALGYSNKTYTCSLELQLEEAQAFANAAFQAGFAGGDITAIAPFDVSITFGNIGQTITTHTLKKCVFLDNGVQGTSGDGTFVRTYALLPADIIFAE